jgi:hypothetical protein
MLPERCGQQPGFKCWLHPWLVSTQ